MFIRSQLINLYLSISAICSASFFAHTLWVLAFLSLHLIHLIWNSNISPIKPADRLSLFYRLRTFYFYRFVCAKKEKTANSLNICFIMNNLCIFVFYFSISTFSFFQIEKKEEDSVQSIVINFRCYK